MVQQESPGLRRARHDAVAARRVREVCVDATSTAELIDGLLEPFSAALGVSGMIVGSTDPATAIMSTATLVENLPIAMAEPWMHNEIFDETSTSSVNYGAREPGRSHWIAPRREIHTSVRGTGSTSRWGSGRR